MLSIQALIWEKKCPYIPIMPLILQILDAVKLHESQEE